MALASRKVEGSWFAPGAFFAAAWAVFCVLALLLVFDTVVWPEAILWIELSTSGLALGSWLGIVAGGNLNRLGKARFSGAPELPASRLLIVLTSIAGLGVVVGLLHSKGIGLNGLLTPSSLARTEHTFSVARYLQGYTEPLSSRLLVISIYFAALLSGLVLASKDARKGAKWIAVLPLVPSLAVTLVATERSAVVYPIVLMVAAYLAWRVASRQSWKLVLNARRVSLGVLAVTLLIGVSILVLLGRYGYTSRSQFLSLFPTLRYDAFGYLAAFSRWFHNAATAKRDLSMGGFTFAGLFDALHLRTRSSGIYTDSVHINGTATNIFTIFRGLIQDFGLLGATGLLALIGFISGLAYCEARRGNGLAIAVLTAFFATTLWSPIVDLFAYNSVCAAWVLFTVYLAVAAHRSHAPGKYQVESNRPRKPVVTRRVG